MNKLKFVFVILLTLTVFPTLVFANGLQILTDSSPPYSYQKHNQVKGISADVVKAILREKNLKTEIKLYPWARAYKKLSNEKNTLLCSVIRFPAREKLFKWVGPVAPGDFYIYASSSNKKIKIQSIEDLKNYNVVVVRNGAVDQYLRKIGHKNIQRVNLDKHALSMLLHQRADAWIGTQEMIDYYFKLENKPVTLIKRVYPFKYFSTGHYLAFNKNIPDGLVSEFQKGLEKIKAKGTYQKIIEQY